ncbi:MAG TPA: hypothetical protein VKT49_18690 [Bryobacteraceae bacterium]|nr:hypothetical protein [Bryobacteraceae bacterium]
MTVFQMELARQAVVLADAVLAGEPVDPGSAAMLFRGVLRLATYPELRAPSPSLRKIILALTDLTGEIWAPGPPASPRAHTAGGR